MYGPSHFFLNHLARLKIGFHATGSCFSQPRHRCSLRRKEEKLTGHKLAFDMTESCTNAHTLLLSEDISSLILSLSGVLLGCVFEAVN